MKAHLWIACVLSVAACSKKKDESATATTDNKAVDTKAADTKPATPAAPAAAPAEPKRLYTELGCEKLPKSLKDKYFAGKELTDDTNPSNSGGCKAKDDPILGLEVACFAPGTPAGVYDSFVDRIKKVTDAEMLNVGKAAVHWKVGNLSEPHHKVQVYDDDSECTITGVLATSQGAQVTEFAKDAIAAFPMK